MAEYQPEPNNLTVNTQPLLTILGILNRSIRTTIRNRTLVFLILLLVFLSLCQLKLISELSRVQPFDRSSSQRKNRYTFQEYYSGEPIDDRKLLVMLFFLAVYLTLLVIFILFLVEALTANSLSLENVLSKLRGSWQRSVVTSSYMFLLSSPLIFHYNTIHEVISITGRLGQPSFSPLLYTMQGYAYNADSLCVAALWVVSFMVSVLEDGLSGLNAIRRAGKLMREKHYQACTMMIYFCFAHCVVQVAIVAALFCFAIFWGYGASVYPCNKPHRVPVFHILNVCPGEVTFLGLTVGIH